MRFAWPEGEPRTLRAGAVASARSVNDKEILDDPPQDALGTDIELPAGLPPTLAVAGGYLDGIGVPACVAAATKAAASLVTARVAR